MKAVDLSGQKFGRWTAISINPIRSKTKRTKWDCICECGNKGVVFSTNLVRGISKSCGCLESEKLIKRNYKHGLAHHELHNVWSQMKKRCLNRKSINYRNYGGRGIVVCERWLNSFHNFYLDMGERPSPKHSLERINNDEGYYPENCKWATTLEQSRNRRNNRVLNCDGVKKCVVDFAKDLGVHPDLIHNRLRYGWSDKEAVYGK